MSDAASRPVIFTDIDGTLIDLETYEAGASIAAVADLVRQRTPVVLCSSKTRAEQQALRALLGIPDPFVVENGGAIIIPEGYFASCADLPVVHDGGFHVLEPGPGGRARRSPDSSCLPISAGSTIEDDRAAGPASARAIRATLSGLRAATGLPLVGYGDLSDEEVAVLTGLDVAAAQRARKREYSETVVGPMTDGQLRRLNLALRPHGLRADSGGRFVTVTALSNDKGRAVRELTDLYACQLGLAHTVGIGDSANDLPMLAAVDRAFLVQRPGGDWLEPGDVAVTRVPAIGPAGWARVARQLLDEIEAARG
jgi:mannosyl-3-phosphoglycerate phosphatase family protein